MRPRQAGLNYGRDEIQSAFIPPGGGGGAKAARRAQRFATCAPQLDGISLLVGVGANGLGFTRLRYSELRLAMLAFHQLPADLVFHGQKLTAAKIWAD
jgi:hypothetical protein